MHEPKHRATHVPTARRRATTLGTVAFGAIAIGASTLAGGAAQAAEVLPTTSHFSAPLVAAAPPAFVAVAVPVVVHPTTVVVATRSHRRSGASSSVARRAVSAAASRRGLRYRFGAAGPRAFDCSGLTKWSFARAGVSIPRTVAGQYRASHKVAKSAKRPGDLIFYMAHGRAYHVGVYAGHNRVWIAAHTGTRIALQKIYSRNYVVGRIA